MLFMLILLLLMRIAATGLAQGAEPHILAIRPVPTRTLDIVAIDDIVTLPRVLEPTTLTSTRRRQQQRPGANLAEQLLAVPPQDLANRYVTGRQLRMTTLFHTPQNYTFLNNSQQSLRKIPTFSPKKFNFIPQYLILYLSLPSTNQERQ